MSAMLSSLVDSVPVTAMMIKVIISISENEEIGIPIQPLVWAVAFGPCFGGMPIHSRDIFSFSSLMRIYSL